MGTIVSSRVLKLLFSLFDCGSISRVFSDFILNFNGLNSGFTDSFYDSFYELPKT